MPIPSKKDGEKPESFMQRCMGDPVMQREYPSHDQRVAVCRSKACEGMNTMQAMNFEIEENQRQAEARFKYRDPKTGEIFTFQWPGIYEKNSRRLVPVDD